MSLAQKKCWIHLIDMIPVLETEKLHIRNLSKSITNMKKHAQ